MSFRMCVVSLLVLTLGGSVAARAWLSPDVGPTHSTFSTSSADPGSGSPPGTKSFLPKSDGNPQGPALTPYDEEPGSSGALEDALPYVTEGSFFGLIGFALGYFTRKVVKLALLLLGGLFLVVQGMSYLEVITVDWQRAIDLVNDLVFNLKQNQTVTEVLKDRIPTAGALVAGFALGYRKG